MATPQALVQSSAIEGGAPVLSAQRVIATLYLASTSPRRQELIRMLGLPYQIKPSDVDETIDKPMSPFQLVETLAFRKAFTVYEQLKLGPGEKEGIVIGSDTVVVFEGHVLGKPKDAEEAFQMLFRLQGNTHQVYTGITCLDLQSGRSETAHRVTHVTMKSLSEQQIRRYVSTGEPLDKAGSYGIQGLGATIIDRIDGDYFNVVGMSLALLSELLARFGIETI